MMTALVAGAGECCPQLSPFTRFPAVPRLLRESPVAPNGGKAGEGPGRYEKMPIFLKIDGLLGEGLEL